MQLYLKPFYNILSQQKNFEGTTEHQTQFEATKIPLNKFQTQSQIPILLCAAPLTLASVQHYYNLITEQIN